jgi:hypothetical protein
MESSSSNEKPTKTDSIVSSVIQSFEARSQFGQKKYGTNLDRTDLSTLNWIQHAQEELMDGILYLEKLKQNIKNEKEINEKTQETNF